MGKNPTKPTSLPWVFRQNLPSKKPTLAAWKKNPPILLQETWRFCFPLGKFWRMECSSRKLAMFSFLLPEMILIRQEKSKSLRQHFCFQALDGGSFASAGWQKKSRKGWKRWGWWKVTYPGTQKIPLSFTLFQHDKSVANPATVTSHAKPILNPI